MPLVVEIARSLRNATPGRRAANAAWQLAAGYDPTDDAAAYARATFDQHFPATGARGRVLEIGPGGNVAVATLYVEAGADSAVCIDSIPWAANQEMPPNVEYLSPVTLEACDLPAESFDIIYSHATLEHIPDPARGVANIARMLAPGGVTSHQIDLRDHRDFDRPLEFLRHGATMWRLLSAGRWMPPNRLRASDWARLFESNGVAVTTVTATRTADVDAGLRSQFARPFRSKDLDDLRIVSVHLVAEKH